jgi:glutamyl-Q tRNA(Asp) synthetase
VITRFAPSPTGPLHIGHAYSALLAYDAAMAANGTFLLRIEDTDSTRCRPEHEAQILDDLAWLGCTWPTPRRQSDHLDDYAAVLTKLAENNLIFPCSCNRRLVLESGAGHGVDGPIYPGTCSHRDMSSFVVGDAIRLNLDAARQHLPDSLDYLDNGTVTHFNTRDLSQSIGAPILQRKGTGDPAYHLACIHDDALQGITDVIRGADVAPLTTIHVVLQHLMGWPTPRYQHHRLITDTSGKRLAKIDKSKSLASYRADGATPTDIRRMVGLPT